MEKIKIIIDGKEEEIVTKLDEDYIEKNDDMFLEETNNFEKTRDGANND